MQVDTQVPLYQKVMKPVPATIAEINSNSNVFFIREICEPSFSREFHFHEECQLVYITNGKGKRIVGDSIEHFEDGELVFIGSNVPHVWIDEDRHIGAYRKKCSSLSLFISPQKFRTHFSAFGDIQRTDSLFEKAQRGMLIKGQAKNHIIALLETAQVQHGIEQIITLLNIVYALGTTLEFSLLASPNYANAISYKDNERMNRVYHYLLENFNKDIQCQEVAEIAGMNPNAFCRFFKSRTQRSLTIFLNEIRIGHACKLLVEKDESIAQIAYDCGFNNISNFNHFFKLLKKIPPRQFRKEILGIN